MALELNGNLQNKFQINRVGFFSTSEKIPLMNLGFLNVKLNCRLSSITQFTKLAVAAQLLWLNHREGLFGLWNVRVHLFAVRMHFSGIGLYFGFEFGQVAGLYIDLGFSAVQVVNDQFNLIKPHPQIGMGKQGVAQHLPGMLFGVGLSRLPIENIGFTLVLKQKINFAIGL